MNPFPSILLLLLTLSAGAQVDTINSTKGIGPGYYLAPADTTMLTSKQWVAKFDTVAVIMLVGDTSTRKPSGMVTIAPRTQEEEGIRFIPDTINQFNYLVWQIRGYEVSFSQDDRDFYGKDCLNCDDIIIRQHIAYLDSQKKPLTLFVWQSVKIK